jgi:pimeloyl-ACP methyl ester carboxylesterase
MQWQGYSFRDQTISELAALGFGAWAGLKAPHIEQGLATPWAGAEERIFWYGYQSWYIVLAVTLLRQRFKAGAEDSGLRGKTNARYRRLTMSPPPAFKTPDGEVAYWAAYDAAMKLWPVPYEETNIASRFGLTHVVVCGPKDAPPLVLLHGYWATLTMWTPNVADFSKGYRVYAVDVMGQPGKSIPDEPVRNAADYVAWLTATLNGLHLDRVSLVGMSYGGWLALTYAVAAPQRVQKLVLLSPAASVLPIVRQFSLRGMLMLLLPTRFTVNSFMRWLGIKDNPGDSETRRVGNNVVDLMYLGLKHFRMPQAIMPTVFSDTNLRALHVPTLLLLGDREVIYDAATALARARRLLPDFQGDLLPASSHDMCFSQHQLVNARILDFLRKSLTDDQDKTTERSMA